ncbi:hypothetical protein JXA88_14565 [Candidatus Fermentibacteria bacterium]|nr:hypothetical protein [Candidatus Fermentibacteria bacterium]
MVRVALMVLLVPSLAMAGFLEARNAIGINLQTYSGPQQAFYRDLGAQLVYDGYPEFGYGITVRSFGTDRVGAELVFNYAGKSGSIDGLGLSTIQICLGPVFSIPILGQSEYAVPFGCAGVAVVRSSVDIDSQLDMGLYLKLGLQGIIMDHFGVAGMIAYTRVSVKYHADKGLGGAGYIEKNYPFGDGTFILELSYFP